MKSDVVKSSNRGEIREQNGSSLDPARPHHRSSSNRSTEGANCLARGISCVRTYKYWFHSTLLCVMECKFPTLCRSCGDQHRSHIAASVNIVQYREDVEESLIKIFPIV